MFNKTLRDYIMSKSYVEFYDPHIKAEGMYEWDTEMKKQVYLAKKRLSLEKKIHEKLEAKTMVLTIK